jgi:phosphate transport system substrate-binding protein
VKIDGIEPTYDNISGGKYKGARDLYIYLKKQHVGVIPGLDKFVAEYVSDKAIGEDGYLTKKGLVALPKDTIAKVRDGSLAMALLKGDELK